MNQKICRASFALLVLLLNTIFLMACGNVTAITSTSSEKLPSTTLTDTVPIYSSNTSSTATPSNPTVTITPEIRTTPLPPLDPNQEVLDLLKPWTGYLDQLQIKPAILKKLEDWFGNNSNLTITAFTTSKFFDFSSILETMDNLDYYGLTAPLEYSYIFGTIYVHRTMPDYPQIAMKYISLDPNDKERTKNILAKEFRAFGADINETDQLFEQLQDKLHMFLLVVGKDALDIYSSRVEQEATPVTPFVLTETDQSRLILPDDLFEGDLRLFPVTRDASTSWKSLYLTAKGLATFSEKFADKFGINRKDTFSIIMNITKPWRFDTENVMFSAVVQLGDQANFKVTWLYNQLYLKQTNSGWQILGWDDEVGNQLFVILNSLIYPLSSNKAVEGWFFTSLPTVMFNEKLAGSYKLEKNGSNNNLIQIGVRYDLKNYQMLQYSEINSPNGFLAISYEYDNPDIKIEYPNFTTISNHK